MRELGILNQKWHAIVKELDIAFQPIVNIHTGSLYGVEALLRGVEDAGFKSIYDIFDTAYEQKVLYAFDLYLRQMAIDKFAKIPSYRSIKLFYNLDNRLLRMEDFSSGNTTYFLKKHHLMQEAICFELSERFEISHTQDIEAIAEHYQEEGFGIAIDDFGIGYAGFKLLNDIMPDIIKIDRYFLHRIEMLPRKRMLLQHIINLSNQLNIRIIAEGVESEEEYLICKEIGFHLAQGYFIQKPQRRIEKIQDRYEHIAHLLEKSKREKKKHKGRLFEFLEQIDPLNKNLKMREVIEYFKKHAISKVVPVVNDNNEPVGIFLEEQIKEILYSPYGMSLLANSSAKKSKLKHFITPCPFADIHNGIKTIIQIFSSNPKTPGVIITEDGKYVGFLFAHKILQMINEENLETARDQNPLTRLPGNRIIERYLQEMIESQDKQMLCYFDLDYFKAFNDAYGFRLGDRVIQLFADTMNKVLPQEYFKAHIGGDDFFAATKVNDMLHLPTQEIQKVQKRFAEDVLSFYSKEDRQKGYIEAKDREGNKKRFPFLRASVSVIGVYANRQDSTLLDRINMVLSLQKKCAKSDAKGLSSSCLLTDSMH